MASIHQQPVSGMQSSGVANTSGLSMNSRETNEGFADDHTRVLVIVDE